MLRPRRDEAEPFASADRRMPVLNTMGKPQTSGRRKEETVAALLAGHSRLARDSDARRADENASPMAIPEARADSRAQAKLRCVCRRTANKAHDGTKRILCPVGRVKGLAARLSTSTCLN